MARCSEAGLGMAGTARQVWERIGLVMQAWPVLDRRCTVCSGKAGKARIGREGLGPARFVQAGMARRGVYRHGAIRHSRSGGAWHGEAGSGTAE